MPVRILIFVPAYNCEKQIPRVAAQLDAPWVREHFEQAIIVDNVSKDSSFDVAQAEAARRPGFLRAFRNADNRGLGGSHKTAFAYAREKGYNWVLVLHGDDQGSIEDFRHVVENKVMLDQHDCILGSRFMTQSRTPGYSKFRIFGNHVMNMIYTICLGRRVMDLGSGLNLFRVAALPPFLNRAPDDLTFNCVLLATLIKWNARIRFEPISWREDDQVSNVKLVRQSIRTVIIPLRAALDGPEFLYTEHRARSTRSYSLWNE